jgi:hypothetical protein
MDLRGFSAYITQLKMQNKYSYAHFGGERSLTYFVKSSSQDQCDIYSDAPAELERLVVETGRDLVFAELRQISKNVESCIYPFSVNFIFEAK